MRRRLRLLSFAVTSLLVVSYTIPLALLVARQADERARSRAERHVQEVAAEVVRLVVALGETVDTPTLGAALGDLSADVAVELPDGSSVGAELGGSPLVGEATVRREAVSRYFTGGWEVALPVLTRLGPVVVWTRVPTATLREGVEEAWALLGVLGLLLVGLSLLVADRLGRSLVRPVDELALAARRLASGDLSVRVDVSDPEELAAVARAFNTLAPRLAELLLAEREQVADISHRLRTPLTTVRLQAESLTDPEERAEMLARVDRMQRAVDEVIADVRRRTDAVAATSDLAAVVADRVRFWSVLAEEQGRAVAASIPSTPLPVPVPSAELGAAVDTLVGNVFAHTPPGVPFTVTVRVDGPTLVVADRGPGFPPGFDPTARGASGAGSTGLGLDIVRRLAERCHGSLRVGAAPEGGAVVEVVFGP